MSDIKYIEQDPDTAKPGKGRQQIQCPSAIDCGRKKTKEKCFTWNEDKEDARIGYCHHCQITFVLKKKNNQDHFYKAIQIPVDKPGDKTKSWFKSKRGISPETLEKANVRVGKKYISSEGREVDCIQFLYYQYGILVNIKSRSATKGFALETGAEKVFYNMDLVPKESESLYIVEGEIDALTFIECGIINVVSVPNGASKGRNNLDYFDNCQTFISRFSKFVIATDSDEAGISLRMELARRLGVEKCEYIDWEEHKDGNQFYLNTSKEEFISKIGAADPMPVYGLIEIPQVAEQVLKILNAGYPTSEGIGSPTFDSFLKFRPGELTVVTGKPGGGKSEFVDFISLLLSLRSGWKWGVYSAENQPVEFHVWKLLEKLEGKRMERFTEDEAIEGMRILKQYFHFINVEEAECTIDGILEYIRLLVKMYGINGFIIDNWATIEHKYNGNESRYISEVINKITACAKALQVHIILVAHPKKPDGISTGLYAISGSAHFFNLTDNGLTISIEQDESGGYYTKVVIEKVRFKFVGKKGEVRFEWQGDSGRYLECRQQLSETLDLVVDPFTGKIHKELNQHYDQDFGFPLNEDRIDNDLPF